MTEIVQYTAALEDLALWQSNTDRCSVFSEILKASAQML